MIKKQIITLALVLLTLGVYAQEALLSGRVLDAEKKSAIADVNILVKELRIGTSTDEMGKFSFKIPTGKYTLILTSVGYKKLEKKITIKGSDEVLFYMQNSSVELGEVTISQKQKKASVLKINATELSIPVSFTTIENKLITQTQSNDINDLLKYSTGIRPKKEFGVKQTFVMRGFSRPVVMVDGVRDDNYNSDPYETPITSLAAVERVEYLKGPSSVLYGHSAVGGVLNIVRKQPTKKFEGKFTGTYGSWNTRRANLDLGGKADKNLYYRINLNFSESDGWRDLKRKYANAYLALDYHIDEKNIIEIRTGANDDSLDPEGGIPFAMSDLFSSKDGKLIVARGDKLETIKYNQRYNSTNDYMNANNFNISGKYIHKFSKNTKLSIKSSYVKDDTEYQNTAEGLVHPSSEKPIYEAYKKIGDKKLYLDITKLKQSEIARHRITSKTQNHNAELSSSFSTGALTHDFTLGYAFSSIFRNIDWPSWGDFSGPGAFATLSVENPKINTGEIKSQYKGASLFKEQYHGVYLQDLIEITPYLKVMIGGRFDYYKLKRKMEMFAPSGHLENKASWKRIVNNPFSYRAGLVFNPTKEISLYGSYSSFFKPIRITYSDNYLYFDKNGDQLFPEKDNKVFDPETGYQWEAGIKWIPSEILTLNLSGYYIQKENILHYSRKEGEKPKYSQVAKIYSQGIEADAIITPFNGFDIRLGYSFCEAKYDENNVNKFGKLPHAGRKIPNLPEHQFYSWLHYTVSKGMLKNIGIGLGFNYVSDMTTHHKPESSLTLPSYGIFDASLSYHFKRISLNLKANNILNKKYYPNSVWGAQFIPGEERNILFSVGVKF